MPEANETACCGRSKKCGWRGLYSELIPKEVEREDVDFKCTILTCPNCEGDAFMFRPADQSIIDHPARKVGKHQIHHFKLIIEELEKEAKQLKQFVSRAADNPPAPHDIDRIARWYRQTYEQMPEEARQ